VIHEEIAQILVSDVPSKIRLFHTGVIDLLILLKNPVPDSALSGIVT
jgi:hypothetical protein